jgi:hypothetical protein
MKELEMKSKGVINSIFNFICALSNEKMII